jgi:hypothetical protein
MNACGHNFGCAKRTGPHIQLASRAFWPRTTTRLPGLPNLFNPMFLDKKFNSIRAHNEAGQPCSRVSEFLWRHAAAPAHPSRPHTRDEQETEPAAKAKRD